jgi:hypothetical protein
MYNEYDADLLYAMAKEFYVNNKIDKAFNLISQSLKIDPHFYPALTLKGEILAAQGDITTGLPLAECWRYDYGADIYAEELSLRWYGNPTDNLVLIRGDQGHGDTLLFLRYMPMVQERCTKLMIMVQNNLERLVAQSFPGLLFTPYDQRDKEFVVVCSKADFPLMRHTPVACLPTIFGSTIETLPGVPYLKADKTTNGGVGFCWYSGRNFFQNVIQNERFIISMRNKSIPHCLLKPLIEKTNGISLQHEDLKTKDFAETAAILNGLDLIITVDTSIANLACALGKKTWVLLMKGCDWRWGHKGDSTPWYPTARLFRQKTKGDWFPVIKELEKALKQEGFS